MSVAYSSWLRSIKKALLAVAILMGLYLFSFFVSRSVLNSLSSGIESSRATGLSAVAPSLRASYVSMPAYQSAEGLLEAGGLNVVRAVSIALEASSFETAQSRLMEITQQSGGFLEGFKVHRQSESSPWLEARLRLPVSSLDSTLAKIRSLGTVRQETESSESTSAEKESLSTQLEAKRLELSRLNEIVKHRTGSLSDSVAAEEKLSERRKEADELERRLKKLDSRVEYALVELQITEQYQAHLAWHEAVVSSDLHNSLIEGLEAVLASFAAVLGFLLRYGLVLFVWIAVLYWPSSALWRRYGRSHPVPSSTTV